MEKNAHQEEVKETWAKPELEMVSVKESTLGLAGPTDDGLTFS